MKTKDFQKYLEKRLNKEEIDDIEKQAALEIKYLESQSKQLNTLQACDNFLFFV